MCWFMREKYYEGEGIGEGVEERGRAEELGSILARGEAKRVGVGLLGLDTVVLKG